MVKVASLEADIKINTGEASKKLDDVNKKLEQLDHTSEKTARNTSLNWVVAIGSMMNGAAKVVDFLKNQANRVGDLSYSLDKLTRTTGHSAKEFQRWKAVMEQAGGSFDDFMSTIQNIQKIKANFMMTGALPEVFARLGIMPTGEDVEILNNVVTKLKQINDIGLRNYFAAQAGISPDMIGILSSDRINGYYDRAMELTDKQIETAKQVEKMAIQISQRWEKVFDKIGAAIGTPAKEGLLKFSNFFLEGAESLLGGGDGGMNDMVAMMRKAGLSENAIAGIIGNASLESSLNPMAKNGQHKGLFQWYKPRWQEYMNFLGVEDEDSLTAKTKLYSIENQFRFMLKELKDFKMIDALNKAGSPEEAAEIFEAGFEKSGGQALNERRKRAMAVGRILATGDALSSANISSYSSGSTFSPSGGAYSGVSNFSEFNRGGDTSNFVINNDIKISADRVDGNSIKSMNTEQMEKATSGAVMK